MKNIIILLFILRALSCVAAQPADLSNRIWVGGYMVSGVSNDPTMPSNSSTNLTTEYAVNNCAKSCAHDTADALRSSMSMYPKLYDKTGSLRNVPIKIMTDTFSVNAGNDYTVSISSMGYTAIFNIVATAIKTSASGFSCPSVNIDHYDLNTVYLDFTQGNNALPVLAVLFPGTVFVSSFTGLKVAVTIIGY